jgi:hypothetical protein
MRIQRVEFEMMRVPIKMGRPEADLPCQACLPHRASNETF